MRQDRVGDKKKTIGKMEGWQKKMEEGGRRMEKLDGGLELQMRDEKDGGSEKVSDQKKVERAEGLKIVIGW